MLRRHMTAADKKRQREAIRFWREQAARDRATAKSILKSKHYDWSLFLYHLALEKLLKALVVAAGETPPYTHNLLKLARLAGLAPTATQEEWFDQVTKFQLEARYPAQKLALHRLATPPYSRLWHHRCDRLYLWLEEAFDA